jgi:putative endonuclease
MPLLQSVRAWLQRLFATPRPPATPATSLGNTGENQAAQHLRKLGWHIIIRNWRHRRDEIDIVARDGKDLVFIEVKTRTTTGSHGYHAVDKRKRNALARACCAYLNALPKPISHYRFDIIEVKRNPTPQKEKDTFEIVHHRNIPLFRSH